MSEELVNKLFPNIPGPQLAKRLRLESEAREYIKIYGSCERAIAALDMRCRTCAIAGCNCRFPEVIKAINEL